MFRKLISNVSFSPALIGQLGFYAKRLRKEEATRRAGLIFTALALVVQSFAVLTPPEPANAASASDFIRGGVTSVSEFLKHYDKNDRNLRDMMSYIGITRDEIANTKKASLNSRDDWLSWGRVSPFSASQGNVAHHYKKSGGGTGTMHSKPLKLWDSTAYTKKNGSTYVAFVGTSKKIGKFAILAICGNAVTKKLPPKAPTPPKAPSPIAACSNLEVIRASDTQRRFKVTATAEHGATISKYTFGITDAAGKAVRSFDYVSTSSVITTGDITLSPGKYTVKVTVATSLGNKESTNCTATFTVDKPGVAIEKTAERTKVELGQEFSYKIVVKNTGKTTLTNLVVTDEAPGKIQFISATSGTTTPTNWTRTIASLESNQSASFTIKAKAVERADPGSTIIKNTACVETTAIKGSPDACDDASVEIPETLAKVCDLTTDKVIWVPKSQVNDSRYSTNPADCTKIKVCDKISGIIVTIREPAFDSTTQTKTLAECDDIQVCDLNSGEIIVIKRTQLDTKKHSEDAGDCVPAIAQSKSGLNITQDSKNATNVTARANDRIQYTISVHNIGDVKATAKFKEDLQDVLEYATIIDNGGGVYDEKTKTLTWADAELEAGESKSRMFVVQLASTIPAGARGVSERSSYDCIMTNSFGDTVDINVACPAQKQIEQTASELPTTGPGENLLFAGVLLAVVVYFYARSRQLTKEVRYIRRDLNAGTI